MKYELAKKLKDAGFPQMIDHISCNRCEYYGEERLCIPTLSELIEACGDDFRWLKKRGHGEQTTWLAQGRPHPTGEKEPKCIASTPEEAVANLWLKLQGL